jgi:hypothetical protein
MNSYEMKNLVLYEFNSEFKFKPYNFMKFFFFYNLESFISFNELKLNEEKG